MTVRDISHHGHLHQRRGIGLEDASCLLRLSRLQFGFFDR